MDEAACTNQNLLRNERTGGDEPGMDCVAGTRTTRNRNEASFIVAVPLVEGELF